MALKKTGAILALVLALSGLCPAQNENGRSLTLAECVDLALKQNPLVLSSIEQVNASLARVRQAGAFPQPVLSFDLDLQPSPFNLKGSRESYVGVEQDLEFPGKRLLRRRIASLETEEARSDLELLKQDVAFQVREAFFAFLLAEKKVVNARQGLELAEDFLGKAETKQKAGDVADVEVLRAQVEKSKAANAVQAARNDVRLAAARLNFLLARRKYDRLEIRGDLKKNILALDVEELKRMAFLARPEMKKLQASLDRVKAVRKQAVMEYFPDFSLGLAKHRIDGEKSTWDFTASFPIPLFFWQPLKGAMAEAEALSRSLLQEEAHLKNTIALEVEEACLNAATAGEQIGLFEKDILAQAEEVYKVFLLRFQEGDISGIELIEARRSLVEARDAYSDALFNYAMTLAALEKSIGQPLQGDRHDS